MTYAIEMYFDKETENKIMNLAQKVADAKLSKISGVENTTTHYNGGVQ